MTMLASAGIYLVLDVNSPLPDHHLNRYEPWTTYHEDYMKNVYEVVHQFSGYNNTLGFFAGNEVVNDKLSARNSPVYIKAVVRDIKTYIEYHSPRAIPVGYSAADDLQYRVSLSDYLECVENDLSEAVDFYGVNSYQWCGKQTMHTSGYDKLVAAYSDFARPVFFSEYVFFLFFFFVFAFFTNSRYGCNEITPREFSEVQALYSKDMINVFSGGLIYEFSQEPNNYGLVEILPNNDVRLLRDFHLLKTQFSALPELDYGRILNGMKKNLKAIQKKLRLMPHALPVCVEHYDNLGTAQGMPPSAGEVFLSSGVQVDQGKYVELEESSLHSSFKVFDVDGSLVYIEHPTVQAVEDTQSSWSSPGRHTRGFQNCTYYEIVEDGLDDDDAWDEDPPDWSEKPKKALLALFGKVARAFSALANHSP